MKIQLTIEERVLSLLKNRTNGKLNINSKFSELKKIDPKLRFLGDISLIYCDVEYKKDKSISDVISEIKILYRNRIIEFFNQPNIIDIVNSNDAKSIKLLIKEIEERFSIKINENIITKINNDNTKLIDYILTIYKKNNINFYNN